MKIHKEFEQGSQQWFEIKHAKVGGSRLAKIMANLDKSVRECAEYYAILAEHMEDFDPYVNNFQSYEMERGNELEPVARREYERIYGVKVEQYGWCEHDTIKICGISPDGHIPTLRKSIEIKCPSDNTHVIYMLNPTAFFEKYCWQIVDNFLVMDVESTDCISFRPENRIKPMVVYTATPTTMINISKKECYPVSTLVDMANKRLLELEECIKEDLERIMRFDEF